MNFLGKDYNSSFSLAVYSNIDLPCLETVSILCKEGRLKEALEILHLMDQRAIQPSIRTYALFFQGCANMKALAEGKVMHAHMIQCGLETKIILGNLVFNMYAKCQSMEDARQVFDEMPQRDLVSWSGLISSYAHNGFSGVALRSFREMQCSGEWSMHANCLTKSLNRV